jgi:glucose-6-phosphate isomerase
MDQFALQDSPAFKALQSHHDKAAQWQMRTLFQDHPNRFKDMSLEAAGLFLDYSKNRITSDTMRLLCDLARARGIETYREKLFAGETINNTERRAVLHPALRAPVGADFIVGDNHVSGDVQAVLEHMRVFSNQVRSGEWLGTSGKAIKTIVNIGIGGSFLGPKLACHALRAMQHPALQFHFVSNVDANELDALLPTLDPETTLFIVVSKTFGTAETMLNAHSARDWLVQRCGLQAPLRHFVAVSTNREAVTKFGIDPANMFGFWDWVGGRYSLWSAVGLVVALAIGADAFEQFLAGGHAMDQHFQNAPLESNMPVIMALIGIWYRNFFNCTSLSIAPYWQDLQYLPGYLQQLDMESNGKRVDRNGVALQMATAPVIWGDVGTNGQHAYFQMLHQGTDLIPVDFITVLKQSSIKQSPSRQSASTLDASKKSTSSSAHHTALLANCFAQSAALMRGKTEPEAREEMRAKGMDEKTIAQLAPHKTFPGNRPSNTLMLPEMTPHALGSLIALYEHKVFVQGVVWGINSFDQWGVELGKELAKSVEMALNHSSDAATDHAVDHAQDDSTRGLIARVKAAR